MASHFEAIGIGVTSQHEFGERVVSLISAGTARQISAKTSEHIWTDPSGARLVAQVRNGEIEFLLPSLAGTTPAIPVRDVRLVDDETAMLDLLDDVDRQLICPVAVELEDRAVLAHHGGRLESGSLVLAALAEDVTVHADAEAYFASQDDDKPKFGADHFIPSGTFALAEPSPDWTPSAHALFAGEVIDVETPVNTVTGTAFHRIRVRTIAAIELEVAIAATDLEQPPARGNVVSGTFFLTGRLGLQPTDPAENPPKRRRWFRR
ncbi:hypothetical protein SAMN05421837_102607 [Amycolatopsis pretoriensis]|uniref:Uncharacterized protein n=1 Tax=Amycolatopsis pretoriensis TaxID=218821 RepID=A0A1H5QDQ0_9PSEU|nr:hypothetical protein [Amycolatopsis pretoriensis]SEF24196.1 hypothetical protein SAMN05421837_102607 [Amycolatopsis pretoriensis]